MKLRVSSNLDNVNKNQGTKGSRMNEQRFAWRGQNTRKMYWEVSS